MPRSQDEKTREFQQRMRTEGAAGFASGPWNEIEESLGMDQSVVVDQEGNPVWSVKHTRKPRHAVSRSTFDRLVGGVAVLAIATLVTSVLAIYYEQNIEPGSSQLARSGTITGAGSGNTIVLPQPPTTGFIERPAVEVVAGPPPADREIRHETADTDAPAAGPDTTQVLTESASTRGLPLTEPLDQAGTAAPTVEPPAEPAGLSDTLAQLDTQDPAKAIEAITLLESPAAIGKPDATQNGDRTNPELSANEADIARAGDTATPADSPVISGQTGAPDEAVALTATAVTDATAMPKAKMAATAGAAHITELDEQTGYVVATTDPTETNRLTDTAAAKESRFTDTTQVARLEPSPAATSPSPAETAVADSANAVSISMDEVPQPGASGRWIINLASYAGPRTADRMQRKFENLGVSTDRQVAEVNGKTMYRLRIATFESRQDAQAYFDSIKDTLGLQSAWITKH